MDERIVNQHRRIKDGFGLAWECLKCGFVVLPEYNGHRCTERSEMYTDKPYRRQPPYDPAGYPPLPKLTVAMCCTSNVEILRGK